ncbi:hypothetical protein [Nonomuraea fuscirosea]|uniref:hypothetical protein n=1 Tax=Nonomuraea fuscirosea TaxID=1291556 RepID=UPI0033DEE5A6
MRNALCWRLLCAVHGWICVPEKAKEDDSTCGESWDLVRTVRAEVIKALLLGVTEADPGWSPPITLRGARVVGRLDLRERPSSIRCRAKDASSTANYAWWRRP